MSRVGLLGDGPAIDAVNAALADADVTATGVDPPAIREFDVAVAVGSVDADAEALRNAGQAARDGKTLLVTIEFGGIGGRPVAGVDAAVSGLLPDGPCYACLRSRIEAVDADLDDAEVDPSTARFGGALAGRELTRLFAGGESSLPGSVVEVPHAQRRLLSVPHCDCAGAFDGRLRRTDGARSLEDAIAAAEAAFDPRLGPVTSIGEVESFPAPYYLATLSDAPFSDADVPEHAAGVAADWDPAFMKALGEALERYSAAVYREGTFLTDPESPIDPDRFVRPDGRSPEVSAWYPAEDLATGESVAVPAELVVFPPPNRSIRPAITTGLGLGNGGTEALLSGLYEVVERDATMLAWYSTYEPLELDVDDETYLTLARRVRSEDLEMTALCLTQDVDVPVVGVCVHREGEWPRFAAGSAADLDSAAAARGAAEEAIQNWLELRRIGSDRARDESGAIGTYADFPEEARTFVDASRTIPAASIGPAEPPEGTEELESLVSRVEAAGLDAYGARVTPRDVESLGFEAVRIVVPEAQPLFTGEPYFGERARSVPESLGFEPRLDREFHPFP